MCIRAIVQPGDEVIIPEPCFVCYEPITTLSGGVPVHLLLKCGECVLLLVNDSQYEQALRVAYAASRQLRD